jgi:hypothetical protein
MLLENAPAECPSMDSSTVFEYMKYRQQPIGQPVIGIDGAPALSKDKVPIVSIGGWNAPINYKQFLSMISKLHINSRQNGQYTTSCVNCFNRFKDEQYMGCAQHRMDPRHQRKGRITIELGNVRFDMDVQNCASYCKMMTKDHIVEGRDALLPWELERCRITLLNHNSLWGLQLWSMIKMQTRLGLREDDLINFRFEDILLNLSCVINNLIENLFTKWVGKSERRKGTIARLLLWADNENPHLCPVRPFLGYIYLSGLKRGYVYPQSHLLGTIEEATEEHQMKSTYLTDCVDLFEQVTGNIGVYGTHTGKKTYYLEGILGDGSIFGLKQG